MPSNYFLLSNGGTKILANANLNNYITAGCYYVEFASDAQSIQNIPYTTAGMLLVRNTIPVSGRNYKQQIYLPFDSDNVYKRHTMDNGETWTEWKSIVTSDNISSQTFSAYGLTIKASKLNGLGIISVQGTTTGAIAQWTSLANLKTELQPSVVNTLFTGASFRANTNGAINATEAIASGTAVNGYCIYVI